MTQDQFYTWMNDPSAMNEASISQLREVIKRYPYFQAAQLMLAKNLKAQNHIDQLNQLQLAAIMAPDRKVFHDYLHDKKKPKPTTVQPREEVQSAENHDVVQESEESTEVQHESIYDLIPEPVVYQLETADLPDPPESTNVEEEVVEPEELSFVEWLDYTKTGKTTSTSTSKPAETESKPIPSLSNIDIIEHFLTQQTEAPKKRAEFFNPQKAGAKSLQEDFTVVSETLAKIYFQQEKYELARQSYQALSLKYPEKSVYFAARLKEIDEKLNSE